MKRERQTKEDYLISAAEFKGLIDRWIRLYTTTSRKFGAASTDEFFKVGKCLEKGADVFDSMMVSDLWSLKDESAYIHFLKRVESILPCYGGSKAEKERESPDPGKWLPVCLYEVIADDLRTFRVDLRRFTMDLQKYHGKTKIRVLLDSNRPMTNFYYGLETRMYREHPNHKDSLNVFN